MFCRNCGQEIDDKAYVCPHCGVKVERENTSDKDSGSKVGWGFLSFFVPIAGLILFCVWKNERPKTAKVCGICALVSAIISVIYTIIYSIILVAVVAGEL